MKFSLFIFVIINHLLCVENSRRLRWSTGSETTSLISVSRFEGIEKYYLQLKEKLAENNNLISVSPKEDVLVRKKICRYIFSSNYFQYKQEYPINVKNTRIQNELKQSYPDIFRSLYIEYRASARLPLRRHYDNPYKLRTVLVPGYPYSLKEYAFLCPVRELRSNIIKDYYVSARYNVNGAGVNATHITGRFVFLRHANADYLQVYALAEEPAEAVLTFNIDLMYFLRKGHNLPIERRQNDPVCKLSPVEKLRLCSALFSSAKYRRRVKFLPSLDSVDTNCEKREIKFFIDVERQHVNNTMYHEWMIVCKAMMIKSGKWVEFYVSRGYGPNRIFVYKPLRGKIVLYHHSVNIGAVKE